VKTLTFNAVTSGGRAFDIDFPLHRETRSEDGVSAMVTALLDAISRTLESGKGMSDGDLLQSLALTLAIRARMLDVAPESARILALGLVDSALQAARSARTYAVGRA
jgi:hypothetical protein